MIRAGEKELIDYINCGREIEFRYLGKMYSITYGMLNGKHVISFCEFYKETTEIEKPDEIFDVSRDGVTVPQMLESITEDDIWIY